jgi:predicted component of type VI protein secretion system
MFHLNTPGSKLPRQSRADIGQALKLLASTRKGEIPYQPDYGLNAVYEAIGDFSTVTVEIEREMSIAIARFEPRIDAVTVKALKVANTSGKALRLEIYYSFETLPEFFSTSLSLG